MLGMIFGIVMKQSLEEKFPVLLGAASSLVLVKMPVAYEILLVGMSLVFLFMWRTWPKNMIKMETAGWCKVCDEYSWSGLHECPPCWEVALVEDYPNWQPDWVPIFAYDPEQAAERFAKQYDCESAEYAIVSSGESGEWYVLVKKDNKIHKIRVWGESAPRYYANEISCQNEEGEKENGN